MSTGQRQPSPYRRDNFWGDGDDPDARTGHVEVAGTDPASHLAHRLLLELVEPVCARTLRERDEEIELSEPCFHLPKQTDRGTHFVEYRQHNHCRRINEETGYINWGETTSTALPQVDFETYMQAVENYLFDRLYDDTGEKIVLTEREIKRMQARKRRAERLFREQQQDSHSALGEFIRQVREGEI